MRTDRRAIALALVPWGEEGVRGSGVYDESGGNPSPQPSPRSTRARETDSTSSGVETQPFIKRQKTDARSHWRTQVRNRRDAYNSDSR